MNLPANLKNTVSKLEQLRKAVEPDVSDFQYLKMDKSGHWTYGADDIEPAAKSTFAFDPASYAQGFVAWDDGELLGEKMATAEVPPVSRADLEDVGVSWNEQQAICLYGMSGDDEGVQLMYKSSSKGGKKAIGLLIDAVIARAKAGEADLCPVIQLAVDSYKHKKYGKIYVPEFSITGWTSIEAEVEEEEAEETPIIEAVEEEIEEGEDEGGEEVEEVEEVEEKPVIRMRKRRRYN
jgi:hypothetical protein